jgi:hypothetical protein
VSPEFAKCFWVNAGNSLFNIVFQFLQTLSAIRINSLFKESLQNEVWRGKVLRSRWPKATPNCAYQGTVTAKQLCLQCGPSPHLVETSNPTCQHCPTPDMFPVANTSCVPKFSYQSVYCCLIRYFLVRIRIAKCFMNRSKRFRREIMFENEHTFYSSLHYVCTCTALRSGLATRATLTRVLRGRLR